MTAMIAAGPVPPSTTSASLTSRRSRRPRQSAVRLVSLAVRIGGTRLIDNVVLSTRKTGASSRSIPCAKRPSGRLTLACRPARQASPCPHSAKRQSRARAPERDLMPPSPDLCRPSSTRDRQSSPVILLRLLRRCSVDWRLGWYSGTSVRPYHATGYTDDRRRSASLARGDGAQSLRAPRDRA